jgi:hypothetical protein
MDEDKNQQAYQQQDGNCSGEPLNEVSCHVRDISAGVTDAAEPRAGGAIF